MTEKLWYDSWQGQEFFCLLQYAQTLQYAGTHPATHWMRTRCSFPIGKVAREGSWLLNIYSQEVWRCEALSPVSIYPPGMHIDIFTFIFRSTWQFKDNLKCLTYWYTLTLLLLFCNRKAAYFNPPQPCWIPSNFIISTYNQVFRTYTLHQFGVFGTCPLRKVGEYPHTHRTQIIVHKRQRALFHH